MPDIPFYNEEQSQTVLQTVRTLLASGYALPGALPLQNAVGSRPVRVVNKNDPDEVIPAFAPMQVSGVTTIGGRQYLDVRKYDGTKIGPLLFNGPKQIEKVMGTGVAQTGPLYRMAIEEGATVAAGTLWGIEEGEYRVMAGVGPYLALGEDEYAANTILAMEAPTTGWHLKAPSGGITGRSGVSINSALCTPYVINDSDTLVELKDAEGSSQTIKTWHIGTSGVNPDAFITAKFVWGKMTTDFEDCG